MNPYTVGEEAITRLGRVTGKVALVTGAGSGIGRAIAVRLAEEGASLLITSKRSDHLADAYAEVEVLSERLPLAVVADQAEASSAGHLIDAASRAAVLRDLIMGCSPGVAGGLGGGTSGLWLGGGAATRTSAGSGGSSARSG